MRSAARGDGRSRRSVLALAAVLAAAGCSSPETDTSRDGADAYEVTFPMAARPAQWQTGVLDGGARLEFTDDAYRMSAGGWPLVSPSMDERSATAGPVAISATIAPVTGSGLYGVACGVTLDAAYVFVVGHQSAGAPYYAIARLRDGRASALTDSAAPGAIDPSDVVPAGLGGDAPEVDVGARCGSRSASGTSTLELVVAGEVVASAQVRGSVTGGQVGLVAVSRSPEQLVVDVREVTIRSRA